MFFSQHCCIVSITVQTFSCWVLWWCVLHMILFQIAQKICSSMWLCYNSFLKIWLMMSVWMLRKLSWWHSRVKFSSLRQKYCSDADRWQIYVNVSIEVANNSSLLNVTVWCCQVTISVALLSNRIMIWDSFLWLEAVIEICDDCKNNEVVIWSLMFCVWDLVTQLNCFDMMMIVVMNISVEE